MALTKTSYLRVFILKTQFLIFTCKKFRKLSVYFDFVLVGDLSSMVKFEGGSDVPSQDRGRECGHSS